MKLSILYISLLCSTFLSCSSVVRVNRFDNQIRPLTHGTIDVFTGTQSIPYEYKEIGLITVDDEGWGRSESELLNTAIQKAKQMGANGLIILSQDKQLDGYVIMSNIPVAINRRIVRATAIVKTGEKKSLNRESDSSGERGFSVADELKKLKQLLDDGALTQEEFERQKKKLLDK